MSKPYHYTACGLDYIYLTNGYEERNTPHGMGIAIRDAEQLHDVIARAVVGAHGRLRGQEVRFLRARLDLSQAEVARVLGVTRGAVAKWEARPDHPVPGTADRALRLFFVLKLGRDELAKQIVELLAVIDERTCGTAIFRETDRGWTREAA